MPRFSPAALLEQLRAILPQEASGELCVAYSGGLDSTVLLHALARAVEGSSAHAVRAIHIDHQLQSEAERWREHSADTARALRIPFEHRTIEVVVDPDAGPEASARKARYAALRSALRPAETLLTAHHADDQFETILLGLMRGAGVRGLSGIPALRTFGPGWIARPLLSFTRAELDEWARSEGLSWVEDPSNANVSFDRNYLRHRIAPLLRERWPAAVPNAARSSRHLAEAGRLLDALGADDLSTTSVGACLDVERLRNLEPVRRRNVLRHWIRRCGARAPSTRKLAAIEHDMWKAAEDRLPCVEWDDVEIRRHRGLLYCTRRQPPLAATTVLDWSFAQPLELPAQLGRLRAVPAQEGLSAVKLGAHGQVRFRAGGESLQPAGDAHHRTLKKLLQSSRVLPWWRDRLPLVYCGDRLVAVGDLWIEQQFAARGAEPAVKIDWEGKPTIDNDG